MIPGTGQRFTEDWIVFRAESTQSATYTAVEILKFAISTSSQMVHNMRGWGEGVQAGSKSEKKRKLTALWRPPRSLFCTDLVPVGWRGGIRKISQREREKRNRANKTQVPRREGDLNEGHRILAGSSIHPHDFSVLLMHFM